MSNDARPILAVVGATGAVGRVVLDVLPLREPLWGGVRLAARPEEVGRTLPVGGEELPVEGLTEEFFDGVDVAVIDVPPAITRRWVEYAAGRGIVVVDNSAEFRLDPQVPLIVPELNPRKVTERPLGILGNPGALVLTLIDTLAALNAGWELTGIVVTTLQAASGMGRRGIARLQEEIALVAGDRELGTRPGDVRRLVEHELGPSVFPGALALNVLPWVGSHAGDGWTTEEVTIREEIRKILDRPALPIVVTSVRVPVITSHSVSLHLTFARPIDLPAARQAIIEAPGVVLLDDPDEREFPTPNDAVGADPRFAGRLRQCPEDRNSLEVFICADNLRKGAALNMLQTADLVAHELAGTEPSPQRLHT